MDSRNEKWAGKGHHPFLDDVEERIVEAMNLARVVLKERHPKATEKQIEQLVVYTVASLLVGYGVDYPGLLSHGTIALIFAKAVTDTGFSESADAENPWLDDYYPILAGG